MADKDEEQVIGFNKLIIAMKGHPGTGKSTLAQALATYLRIPLIDKDDIKDSTFSLHQSLLHLNSPAAAASSILNDLSYDVVWRIASTQLRLSLDGVIVDSPLSRRAYLDRLVEIASLTGARLLVVECKPLDEVTWRKRIVARGEIDRENWHKPSRWSDVESLLEGYGGCTEYDVGGDVPKLVVDTTAQVEIEELVSAVVEFIVSNGGGWLCANKK